MAKKVADLQKYWQEIAAKAGLAPEAVSAVTESLGDESTAKAFRQAFVPMSEYHSNLDEMRADVDGRKAKLDDWYNKEALPAYQTNLAGIERLRQYESLYGEIDPSTTTRSDATSLGFKSKDELDKYLDDRQRTMQAGLVGLAKVTPRLTLDYYKRFGEVLDLDEVEKLAVKEGLSPEAAYKAFIAPKVEEQQTKDFDAKLKAAREQGERDAVSKYKLPVDTTPRESNPFFGRETPAKDAAPVDEARASRSAFLDGWNNYADSVVNKNRT
jgi:hypothetical protein